MTIGTTRGEEEVETFSHLLIVKKLLSLSLSLSGSLAARARAPSLPPSLPSSFRAPRSSETCREFPSLLLLLCLLLRLRLRLLLLRVPKLLR